MKKIHLFATLAALAFALFVLGACSSSGPSGSAPTKQASVSRAVSSPVQAVHKVKKCSDLVGVIVVSQKQVETACKSEPSSVDNAFACRINGKTVGQVVYVQANNLKVYVGRTGQKFVEAAAKVADSFGTIAKAAGCDAD